MSRSVRSLLAKKIGAEQFTDAITQRKAAVNAMARFMTRFDLILTPTVPLPAFPIDKDGPGSIAGQPVADDAWTPGALSRQLHRTAGRERTGGMDR